MYFMSLTLSVPINKMEITLLPSNVRVTEHICEKHLEQYRHIVSVHCYYRYIQTFLKCRFMAFVLREKSICFNIQKGAIIENLRRAAVPFLWQLSGSGPRHWAVDRQVQSPPLFTPNFLLNVPGTGPRGPQNVLNRTHGPLHTPHRPRPH